MNRCPITYEECGSGKYSLKGVRKLNPRLKTLNDFPYSADEQRREAVLRASKMSIQGIQPKLSARLDLRSSEFAIADTGGHFIVKPQHYIYTELPENEDLTMRLAAVFGIETPLHGLVYCKDDTFSYFIRRFDRVGRKRKLPLEDFAQLAGLTRETKYSYSMEKLIALLGYCTFPEVEKVKLLKRSLFNFLIGNEDMHLKNFSLITIDGKVELAPAYDFLNTTIACLSLGKPLDDIEEIALSLNGKKKNLTGNNWINYFGRQRLGLNEKVIEEILNGLRKTVPQWEEMIGRSFLSEKMKELYLDLLGRRRKVLEV